MIHCYVSFSASTSTLPNILDASNFKLHITRRISTVGPKHDGKKKIKNKNKKIGKLITPNARFLWFKGLQELW